MSLPQGDNQKFSGLIRVNISRDTNDRQLIVNEDRIQNSVIHDEIASGSPLHSSNGRETLMKVVRVLGEPVLAAKIPRVDNELEISRDDDESATEEGYEMDLDIENEPSPVEMKTTRMYRLPDFVAGKLRAPKKDAPERLGVETIFPNVCFHFLNGHCIDGSDCLDSHKYPLQKDVYAKLQEIGWENAAKLFRAIVSRCRGLLLNYFVVFARFFAGQRQRGPLINMLAVCEDTRNKIVPHIGKLMKAFVFSGLTYSQTIAIVLKNHRRTTSLTLSIIFNTDLVGDTSIGDLLKGLELLNTDPEFDFDIVTVNHLLAMSCQIGTIAFVTTMIKIFDRLKSRRPTVMAGVDQTKFKKFIDIYENCTRQVSETIGRARISAP